MVLTLYTTLGCHLCEQMEALVRALARVEFTIERIEISEDDTLLRRYGERIPVLLCCSFEILPTLCQVVR